MICVFYLFLSYRALHHVPKLTLSEVCHKIAGYWRALDWQAERLDVSQGHHPEGRRHPDSQGRHRCHC